MKISRSIIAVIPACFTAWLVFCAGQLLLVSYLRPFPPIQLLPVLPMFLPFPFALAILTGVPSSLLLQRMGRFNRAAFTTTGAVIGAVIGFLYFLAAGFTEGPLFTLPFVVILSIILLSVSASFAIGHVIYWMIAMNKSPNTGAHGSLASSAP